MKKNLLIMFCFLTTVALTILLGFHFFSAQKEEQYAPTAIPYLKLVIPELSKWNPEVTKTYMSAKFMKKTSPEVFAQAIKNLSKVGALMKMDEPKFEEVYSGEDQTIISYTVKVTYTTGEAEIMMGLRETPEGFEVYRFNVRSEALAR